MSIERPKIGCNFPARVDITCRVCKEMVEGYVNETNDEAEPTLHDVAFQCANMMQVHLIDEHGYPKTMFSKT